MSFETPTELKYTQEHEWVKIEGDTATIGITDFAQSALGDVVFVELPEVGAELSKGDTFGVVESIKSVSDLYCPLTGEVTEGNEELVDTPEECNASAYEAWMIKVKISDTAELEELMSAEAYTEFCNNQ